MKATYHSGGERLARIENPKPAYELTLSLTFVDDAKQFKGPTTQLEEGARVVRVATRSKPPIYGQHPRFASVAGTETTGWKVSAHFPSRERMDFNLARYLNIILFADLAKLKPSQAKGLGADAPGIDHVSVWRDGAKNLVVLNEPYRPLDTKLVSFLTQKGCRHVALPKHIGTYWAKECFASLIAPPGSLADIEEIAAKLVEGWTP